MMVFPMFPDDILCVIAGMTNMSFSFFFWTNMLARGIGIACTVFFGSGAIIPFHGWGLIVWAVIIIVIALLFYLSVRFKDKIDDMLNGIIHKNKKKNKNEIEVAALSVKTEDVGEVEKEKQEENDAIENTTETTKQNTQALQIKEKAEKNEG